MGSNLNGRLLWLSKILWVSNNENSLNVGGGVETSIDLLTGSNVSNFKSKASKLKLAVSAIKAPSSSKKVTLSGLGGHMCDQASISSVGKLLNLSDLGS